MNSGLVSGGTVCLLDQQQSESPTEASSGSSMHNAYESVSALLQLMKTMLQCTADWSGMSGGRQFLHAVPELLPGIK